jgi:hypothetical protein
MTPSCGFSYRAFILLPDHGALKEAEAENGMPWEIDVRKGTATIGALRREGFTLMRNREKRLIAFHVVEEHSYNAAPMSPRTNDQFVISEEAFEPA